MVCSLWDMTTKLLSSFESVAWETATTVVRILTRRRCPKDVWAELLDQGQELAQKPTLLGPACGCDLFKMTPKMSC